jgi:hypothetical protein
VDEVAAKMRAIAQEIRLHPERWTQHVEAATCMGEPAEYADPDAACWCTLGFLWRDGLEDGPVYRAIGEPDIAIWNDKPERTPSEVADAFEKAALLLESEAKEQP